MGNSHGNRCSCQILSMAVMGTPSACSYDYCRNVLQRRWVMHCNHGQLSTSIEKPPVYDPVVMHEDNTLALLKKELG
jgi:hypothetical protein